MARSVRRPWPRSASALFALSTCAALAALPALGASGCTLEPPPRAPDDAARRPVDPRCAPERARKPQHVARFTADDATLCDAACLRGPAGSCLASGVILARAPGGENRARVAFERGCAYGFGEACTRAVRHLRGGSFDADRVATLARRACELEDPDGCVELDRLLARGLGVRADPEGARADLTRRCDGGLASACGALAELSDGTARPAEVEALRDRACELGDGAACAARGRQEEARPPKERDGQRLLGSFGRACELGVADACAKVARIHDEGLDGVPRDAARAFALFEIGCDDGDELACLEIGARLDVGEGVAADAERGRPLVEAFCARSPAICVERAGRWSKLAAPQAKLAFELADVTCEATRDAQACALAARLLLGGVGVARDLGAARVRLARACAAGLRDSCRALAASWVGVDDARAASFYAEACQQDDAPACLSLADAYAHGVGVARELRRAEALLIRAREAATPADRASFEGAAEALRKACDARAGASCLDLGLRIAHGLGPAGAPADAKAAAKAPAKPASSAAPSVAATPDPWPRAFAAFQRGCEIGRDGASCVRLARALLDGRGAKRDPAKGAKLLEVACTPSDAEACVELAWAVAAARPNDLFAPALLDDVCRRGDARACDARALGAFEGRLGYGYGDPDERAAILGGAARRCEEDAPLACYALALAYERGPVAGAGAPEARDLHERACGAGVAAACVRQAALDGGEGEPLEDPMVRACELGAALACDRPPRRADAVEPGEVGVPAPKRDLR